MRPLPSTLPAGARTVALLSLALLLACGDAEVSPEWAGTVDTLHSGTVHVTSPMEAIWAPGAAWTLTEELRLGSLDGADAFGDVQGLAVDPGGRVYVLDDEAGEVRVFGPDGTHLRTFGRKGEGPGELKRPVGLDWVEGEGLWVPDIGNARFSLFGPEGEFVRSRPRQVSGFSSRWRGVVTGGGEIVDFGFVDAGGDDLSAALVRLDEDGAAVDTFLLPAYEGEQYHIGGGNFTFSMAVPFSPELVWRYHPDRHIWFGVPDRYRLYQRTLEGDTLRIVERPFEPVPVSSEERAREEEELREQNLDLGRIPDAKPAFDAIFWDDAGRLWVRVEGPAEEENRLLDVFDPEGRYLGRVRAPVPVLDWPPPVIRGDHMWGATRDELEVEYVVRLRIGRPGGGVEEGG